ncbi:MAG TPA: ABC transporter permease [Solirubrobacteraceae bacterium]|jgi:peptide/nickel transport system permease protein|nr:ABC transporter permease [Solirubrobacteraceae bacterium]
MARFVARRLFSMVLVLFTISILTFLIFQAIPNGDPALRLAGRTATAPQIEDVRRQWGFDKPIYVQYARTMEKIIDGEVISYSQQQNVEQEVWRDLPVTISLALGAGILFLIFGVLFGVLSAITAGRTTDRALTVLAMFGISMPAFFLAAVMSYYLGYKWGIFPIGGYVKLTDDPWGWFTHLIMPWVSLAILQVGVYSRLLRSNILDTLGEDYVRTARAKGLSERRVLSRHVLRNSLIPVVSLWGLDLAALFGGGALLIEIVFDLHGVGQYAAESIGRLDVPPILVITMLTAFFVVLMSAITDILYAALDPRIRFS